ncbi:SMP-30/gluconolactonase/LRE family protein [Glaciecola sp. 2405UD65-10]|uniref:SMP-30/gluconolactonase/LRE family protein n=1 Tax=Glaciecola sp. 2405UD65-10 TaxID=3397244 RepID=UPI003B5A915B
MLVKQFLYQIPCQNILGENVLWCTQEQALFWTDIHNKLLHIWHFDTQIHQTISLPYKLATFAFTERKEWLMAGFEQGLALFNYKTREMQWVADIEKENPHTRMNDGKCDPKGRYWFGTMVSNGDYAKLDVKQQGALYSAHFDSLPEGSPIQQVHIEHTLSGIHISNGLCFNNDASVMYHSDSSTHKVYQYELDEDGYIIDQRLFAKFEKHCFPDGACVDTQGNVWIALWGGACVVCLNSEGQELFRYPIPVTQGACVAIGGPNMDHLFITSAQENLPKAQLAKQPRAGNVFVYQLSDKLGREEPRVTVPDSSFV